MGVVSQGDVFWADLGEPVGSSPGLARPVVVVQGDRLNASAIATVIVVPLTTNMRWATAPGNCIVNRGATGLPKDSVANVSQIVSIDRALLSERVGRLPAARVALILEGLDTILGRHF